MSKTFSIHPGEVLLTEFMRPYKLTAHRLAKELHVEVSQINDVVQGKRIISADTALRLGKLFNIPAKFWLNLQNDYDLRNANTAELAKIKPLKSAWIPKGSDPRARLSKNGVSGNPTRQRIKLAAKRPRSVQRESSIGD